MPSEVCRRESSFEDLSFWFRTGKVRSFPVSEALVSKAVGDLLDLILPLIWHLYSLLIRQRYVNNALIHSVLWGLLHCFSDPTPEALRLLSSVLDMIHCSCWTLCSTQASVWVCLSILSPWTPGRPYPHLYSNPSAAKSLSSVVFPSLLSPNSLYF